MARQITVKESLTPNQLEGKIDALMRQVKLTEDQLQQSLKEFSGCRQQVDKSGAGQDGGVGTTQLGIQAESNPGFILQRMTQRFILNTVVVEPNKRRVMCRKVSAQNPVDHSGRRVVP